MLHKPGTSNAIPRPHSTKLVHCEVCGVATSHHQLYVKCGYPILRCGECGLGSTEVTEDFNPALVYDESYFQGGHSDGYADYIGSEQVLRREFRHTLERLQQYSPKTGGLLEVGCAYGFFLQEAQRYYQCTGLEISTAAADFCRAHGLDVECGVVTRDFLVRRGPFDVVVMLDCLEHLPKPSEALHHLLDALREGGVLLLSTGDWSSLMARTLGRRWRLMTPPQHLFFFTRANLVRLLNRLGFRVAHCDRPWKLVPVGLALYQLFNRLGLRTRGFSSLNRIQLPLNLYDTIQVIAVKETHAA